jgi:spermidine synthase
MDARGLLTVVKETSPVNTRTHGPTVRFSSLEASIFFLSAAMLMYEILQTITLSLQTMERNAFLVVSLCLLGLGGGGSLATWLGNRRTLSPLRTLWWSALLFSVTLVIAALASSWTVDLTKLIVLGVIPYVFVGVYLAILFKSWPERANRSYFWNLIGSGVGCLGLVWILNGTGDASLTIFVVAGISLSATVLIGLSLSPRRWVVPVICAVILIALVPIRARVFGFLPAPDKGMGRIVNDARIESQIVWSKWGYLGRLDVLKPGKGIENFQFGGDSVQRLLDEDCDVRYLFASGGNWTKAVDFRRNERQRRVFVRKSRNSAPYLLTKEPDVLNIGFGGGVDIFLALEHGARSVVGVDINPLMVEAGKTLKGYFNDFYDDPRVIIEEMDGRTYVRTTANKFDIVTLTAVDTGALLHSNAHVLLENYLYTHEAFEEYLRILRENGLVYVARPFYQMMRTVVTAVSALRRIGVDHPEEHFAIIGKGVVGRGTWRSVVVSRQPLAEEQKQILLDRYSSVVGYVSGYEKNEAFYQNFFEAVRQGRERDFVAEASFDFSPVWDNRPFFYEFDRGLVNSFAGQVLLRILLWVTSVAAVLILVPMFFVGSIGKGAARRIIGVAGYFGAIGAGFMFIEICLIQKLVLFLGHPAYSVTVTLFSILIFSGLGSMFARRLSPNRKRTAAFIWLPILAAAVFYALGLGAALPKVPSDSLWFRVIVVAIYLAPGSFFMGMPFPTMIGLMRGQDEVLIPWAWAINAFTSVAASVLTVLFAMRYGFTMVMYLGAAFYVVALLFYLQRIATSKARATVGG